MMHLLLDPLQYGFIQRSLIVAVLAGAICAVVGSYLMVQRLALLGDAIAHSVLPGLAVAFVLGINLFVGAFVAGTTSALLMNWIRTRSDIKEDAAMGIVFSAFFALGIALITVIQKDNKIDLNHFLFGNILSVTAAEVRDTVLVAAIVLAVVLLLYKELLFFTFDPLGAQASGLPVNLLGFGLTALIALAIVASMKTMGVVLVLSLLIAPGATAYLLVPRFHQVILLGAALGILSSVSGMYVSYYVNIPSGPAIVLIASGLFLLAFLFAPRQGVLIHPSGTSPTPTLWRELRQLLRLPRH